LSIIKANTFQDRGGNTILSSDGSGTITASSSLASSVASVGGIDNTPAFFAFKNDSNQTFTQDAWSKITFNNEVYDTNGAYADSRFTPGVAGKYFLGASVRMVDNSSQSTNVISIYKNGAETASFIMIAGNSSNRNNGDSIHVVLEADADDYFEVYMNSDDSSPTVRSSSIAESYFYSYKLIGV
jgi:hypothetical protein